MVRRLLGLKREREDRFDFVQTLGGYQPPSFPSLIASALDLLADPMVDLVTVAQALELDPGVSARMLRLVNSAAMAPRSPITSVHQAAVLLGRNQLEALLISVGAAAAIPHPQNHAYEHRRFWATAAKRAALASRISTHVDRTRRSENFTAALLQDMAIPVLALRADLYGNVLEYWHSTTEDLTALEVSEYGWHHGDVAAWMGAKWGFPDGFVDFMGDHHEDADGPLLPAHLVSPIREADDEGDTFVIESTVEAIGLPSDEVVAMINDATIEANQLAGLLA